MKVASFGSEAKEKVQDSKENKILNAFINFCVQENELSKIKYEELRFLVVGEVDDDVLSVDYVLPSSSFLNYCVFK